MNNCAGFGKSGKIAWPPVTLSKQTALTGLFSNNPLFATASYGTTVQPFIPPEGCQYQVNFSFVILEPQDDGTYKLQLPQEQVTSITNIGFNDAPSTQNLVDLIKTDYSSDNDLIVVPIELKFYYSDSQQVTLKGTFILKDTPDEDDTNKDSENNDSSEVQTTDSNETTTSKQVVLPSILFPPVIPLLSAQDPFIIQGAELFFLDDQTTLTNDTIIINNGVLYLC